MPIRIKIRLCVIFISFITFSVHSSLFGQAYDGYTLYAPNNSRYTYLIDMNKNIIHKWTHNKSGGYSVYLLSDGSILRPALSTNSQLGGGGEAGIVQRVAWDGALLWEYTYSSSTYRTHHDIEPMPNGNVLLIAWEVKTAAQAVQAGLNRNSSIWVDHIIEVQPTGMYTGTIVWEWHAWDHLVQNYNSTKSNYGDVAAHPELLNINMGSSGMGMGGAGDWMHINGISYNSESDQIVISSHTLNEIYVIDHSTTTAEAATHSGGKRGKGGDILYRWGMPSNYGASGAQYFYVVHCANWISKGLPGAGNILAFNNGESQRRSTVVELVPPIDISGNYIKNINQAYGPSNSTWSYSASDFYSNHLGGCQRLPNGNTLIVESTSGYIFEVNASGTRVWEYSPGGEIVRALRYSPDYAGLKILDTDKGLGSIPENFALSQNFPNPFNPSTIITYDIPDNCFVNLKVFDITGKEVKTLVNSNQSAGRYKISFSADNLNSGIYFYRLRAGDINLSRKMIIMR